MSMQGYYVAVEGPIGVGKTTVAKKLGELWNAAFVAERVDDNPLLAPFYEAPEENAFHLQLYFLIQRSEQQRRILAHRKEGMVVSDYILAKDDLFARLVLAPRRYKLYQDVSRELSPANVRPDVVVYLRAGVNALMGRIRERGRDYEKKMDEGYLARVVEAYGTFFASYDRTPVIAVDTETVDLSHDEKALLALANKVGEAAWASRPSAGPGGSEDPDE
ncbi:MAG: deoxynucleoside kinase [Planctomycetes bacterium]|nr:deoxynucleoside kinase [Planctomycetota bacterium]